MQSSKHSAVNPACKKNKRICPATYFHYYVTVNTVLCKVTMLVPGMLRKLEGA
jgi:hypothetical protein